MTVFVKEGNQNCVDWETLEVEFPIIEGQWKVYVAEVRMPNQLSHCFYFGKPFRVLLENNFQSCGQWNILPFVVDWPISFRDKYWVELVDFNQLFLFFYLHFRVFKVGVYQIVHSLWVFHIFYDNVASLEVAFSATQL